MNLSDVPRSGPANTFEVSIQGIRAGSFESVENLRGEIDVVEYKDGSETTVRKMPGRTRYADVTLRRGTISTPVLWNWWKEVSSGNFKRRAVTVKLLDKHKNEVMRWILSGCWPSGWEFAAERAETPGTLLVESITFVVENIELKVPSR